MVLRLKPLQAWTSRVQDGLRDTLTWDDLISRVRAGPPLPLRFVDEAINAVEYFVHHEDLRRAQLGWQPRALAPSAEAALWRRLGAMRFWPLLLSAVPGYKAPTARLEAPGRPPIVLSKRSPGPVVRGPAGEVVLWLLGRKSVAQVEVVEAAGSGPG
jgi:uncharacterized protein (TIGR03085 family)